MPKDSTVTSTTYTTTATEVYAHEQNMAIIGNKHTLKICLIIFCCLLVIGLCFIAFCPPSEHVTPVIQAIAGALMVSIGFVAGKDAK